jgi:hypothetical protein
MHDFPSYVTDKDRYFYDTRLIGEKRACSLIHNERFMPLRVIDDPLLGKLIELTNITNVKHIRTGQVSVKKGSTILSIPESEYEQSWYPVR